MSTLIVSAQSSDDKKTTKNSRAQVKDSYFSPLYASHIHLPFPGHQHRTSDG